MIEACRLQHPLNHLTGLGCWAGCRPCHYVAIDRANQCIVLSVRRALGSSSSSLAASQTPSSTCHMPVWLPNTKSLCHHGTLLTVAVAVMALRRGCRGSLQVGDLLSDLAAAPMEVEIGGADGWVHQVCAPATASRCWQASFFIQPRETTKHLHA